MICTFWKSRCYEITHLNINFPAFSLVKLKSKIVYIYILLVRNSVLSSTMHVYMKNIYILAIFLFTSAVVSAQTFTMNVIKDSVLEDISNYEVNGLYTFTNTSGAELALLMERTGSNLAPSHKTNFCWSAFCYAPTVALSPDTVFIQPGETDTTFKATLVTLFQPGISNVSYRVFNALNPSDEKAFTVHYEIVTALSTDKLLDGDRTVSEIYPNPTTGSARLDFELESGDQAYLNIFNVLGSKVMSQKLDPFSTSLTIQKGDLKPGIYLYSVDINGKISSSKKLIVR